MTQITDKPNAPNNLKYLGLGINTAGAIALLLIFAAFYLGLYKQLELQESRVFGEELMLTEFLGKKNQILNKNRVSKTRLVQQEERLAELLERIPSTPCEANFLAQLSNVADQAGITIREFNPAHAVVEGKHSLLEIQVVADASYEGVCRFLDGLSKLPRLCQVVNFEIVSSTKSHDEQSNGIYQVNAKLRIFFSPDASNLAKLKGAPRV